MKPLPANLACALLFNFLAIKPATGLKEFSSLNKEENRFRHQENISIFPLIKSPHILLFHFFLS